MEKSELDIWQRVLQRPTDKPDEDWLTERIAEELAAQRSYQHMARRYGRLPFPMMAQTAGRQARELMALRFLLHGTREPVLPGGAEDGRGHGAAVRGRYETEGQARQTYEEAAKRWPEYGDMFESMADTARYNRQVLRRAAQNLS